MSIPEHLTWDFGGPSSPVGFCKQGEVVILLFVFCLLLDNARIIGL